MVRESIKFPLALLLLLILMTGCQKGRNGQLPASTGQPYEVVVEGDTDSIVTQILTADVPGLPQPEPLCNVINVKRGQLKGSYLMVRTRIVVEIDPRNKEFSAKSSKDVNASPQLVIRIKAKSAEQLRAMLYNKAASKEGEPSQDEEASKNAQLLRNLIDQSELQHLASLIKQNPEKQKEVKRMFGLNMKIPASLDASKKAKNFLWLSNNASTGMQNLLIFKASNSEKKASNNEQKARNSEQIDSILKRNMVGETDNMYMIIPQLRERGLWEMKGDAMGGPYVMKRKGNIVVIAFVYAPEMKKRNLTKQLEAVLSTIRQMDFDEKSTLTTNGLADPSPSCRQQL